MDRQQLDRRDAEAGEGVDAGWMSKPAVRAPDVLRNIRMAHREALDVRLVDDRLLQRGPRRTIVRPVEERAYYNALRHERGRVPLVQRIRVTGIGVHRLVPVDHPIDGPRVRIEQ